MNRIRIASRASKLALAQSNCICDMLKSLASDIEISIVKVSTRGDRDRTDFLYKSESIGFFTSEVENELLEGRADIAVHSLKDLPTTLSPGLIIAAIPRRHSPADALVASNGVTSIEDLPSGASVGTSSLRRIAQLKHRRSDLNCVPLRGNVETRVEKVLSGQIDAAVVACAGLDRLNMSDKISAVLDPEEFVPAPAQGALAVQARAGDSELGKLLAKLNDESTQIAVDAERAVLQAMQGGCSIPLGVYSRILGDTITINAVISDLEGGKYIQRSQTGHISSDNDCAEKIARELLEAGGQEILEEIRRDKVEYN